MYKNTLKGFDTKYSNSLLTNLKPMNNTSAWSNRNQPTEPFVSNRTRNVLVHLFLIHSTS